MKFSYNKWLKEYEASSKWPNTLSIVAILWEDATKGDTMESAGTLIALTPGVLMRANKREVTVAHEVFSDKSERDVTTVPRKMIKNITTLGSLDL